MEGNEFTIRCYPKAELAMMYFPFLEKKQAMQRLRRWIHKCVDLLAALAKMGYQANCHIFSAVEVRLIVFYLGEP